MNIQCWGGVGWGGREEEEEAETIASPLSRGLLSTWYNRASLKDSHAHVYAHMCSTQAAGTTSAAGSVPRSHPSLHPGLCWALMHVNKPRQELLFLSLLL